MTIEARKIDKIRAGRDGNEYHEAWAARKSLQLVHNTNQFIGIAVEGLSPADQPGASSTAIEIADLTFYYGSSSHFEAAKKVAVVQMKYSLRSENVPYRAHDSAKTIKKFAKTFLDYKRRYGAKAVGQKLDFEIVTNRPILKDLSNAIMCLAEGKPARDRVAVQASQLSKAANLTGKDLRTFFGKLRITGLTGDLKATKAELSRVLADWSAGRDILAQARLGELKQLLRDKAGSAGTGRNLVRRTDVLAALRVAGPEALLPCPASFPKVGKVVARKELGTALGKILSSRLPVLVHAEAGVGKTVFLQSLAATLGTDHQVVLFDCFGGGDYRAHDDARHLPKKGLIHIVNTLALESGLCDPLLSDADNGPEIIEAFRNRLKQCVETIQRSHRSKRLILFLDAIDNASEQAEDNNEPSFPKLLLESFEIKGGIAGVIIVASCRTHRRNKAKGETPCDEVELLPFDLPDTIKYLKARIKNVTDLEIKVAFSRTGGNPRILDHLVFSDRGLLAESEIHQKIGVDDLIRERIERALGEARQKGYSQEDVSAFLAGLGSLPPPVPLEEYAAASGFDKGAVVSFAADLAPLLEWSKHGLTFRDEPTETFIRQTYVADATTIEKLTTNLYREQEKSVYAAAALPALLVKTNNSELLFKLAFETRFPASISTVVGKQNIKYCRIKAAVVLAAKNQNFNQLVNLLVELSTIAVVNERGTDYVFDNPELVVASQDVDATRRFLEKRPKWPGARHARLTIAAVLDGRAIDASSNVQLANDWIQHHYREHQDDRATNTRRERPHPEMIDIAAVALWLIAQGKTAQAARFLKNYYAWAAYEIGIHVFRFVGEMRGSEQVSETTLLAYLRHSGEQIGILTAALTNLSLTTAASKKIITLLAKACDKKEKIEVQSNYSVGPKYQIQEGLITAASIAISLGMNRQASLIINVLPENDTSLWSLTDRFGHNLPYRFLSRAAIVAASKKAQVELSDVLPKELAVLVRGIKPTSDNQAFIIALKAEIEKAAAADDSKRKEEQTWRGEKKTEAIGYVNGLLESVQRLVQAFASIVASPRGRGKKAFDNAVIVWKELRDKEETYSSILSEKKFSDLLGQHFLTTAISYRDDLPEASIRTFLDSYLGREYVFARDLIPIVRSLAEQEKLQALAGELANTAKKLIEKDDDVDSRASSFSGLARAILAASRPEAVRYFKLGLEQMDAIGSGDYEFVNELLVFAGAVKGAELEDSEVHMLTNICELSMTGDQDKYPWWDFARAFANISGGRGLAKLTRLHDRNKGSLDYSLLPYVFVLLRQRKIDPALALTIVGLSEPVEYYDGGTGEFAKELETVGASNLNTLLLELIFEFERNHPRPSMAHTRQKLADVAERTLGVDAVETKRLQKTARLFDKVIAEDNEQRNFRNEPKQNAMYHRRQIASEKKARVLFKTVVRKVQPLDAASLSSAIEAIRNERDPAASVSRLFEKLRGKIKYGERSQFVGIVAGLKNLDIYSKERELQACKNAWAASSSSVADALAEATPKIVLLHREALVDYNRLSLYQLSSLSKLSGLSRTTLSLELINAHASPDAHLAASVWLGLASVISESASDNEGQTALKRLLQSDAARLANTVIDGPWKQGLYPEGNLEHITAGMIWFGLGSPFAVQRWRAAHAIRRLARLNRWAVIDHLQQMFSSTNAGPYQAAELDFNAFHARLWFLVAVARLAMDHPEQVAKFGDFLKSIAFDAETPSVQLKHFATFSLLTCHSKGALSIEDPEKQKIEAINASPFAAIKSKNAWSDSFYEGRPESAPEPENAFHFDYDFAKYEIQQLARMFGKKGWEINDSMSRWVRKHNSKLKGMYDAGGRGGLGRDGSHHMNAEVHSYAQHLGWHSKYVAAGEYLIKFPIQESNYDSERWNSWLKRELLTVDGGYWLSDGTDLPPLQCQSNLQEVSKTGVTLTGNRKKILGLLGIVKSLGQFLLVRGHWKSPEGVRVNITSALYCSRDAKRIAKVLAAKAPFETYLPITDEFDPDDRSTEITTRMSKGWIVDPNTELGLDEFDPFGSAASAGRPRFNNEISTNYGLKSSDPFNRKWMGANGEEIAKGYAWGHGGSSRRENNSIGDCLQCKRRFLRKVLHAEKCDLLILVKLERYKERFLDEKSRYWHTTAVVRVKPSLKLEYFEGAIDRVQEVGF